MSEARLAVQMGVLKRLASKSLVINGKGDLSVDRTLISGLDGIRSLKLFMEGVKQDVAERGPVGAEKLYRKKSRIPGSLGKALKSSVNLSRMLDAEEIAK